MKSKSKKHVNQSFLITFLLHVAGVDTNIPLYGLTTIGIGMLFTGMIFYMG
jgi:hypothetical protein